MTSSGQDDTSPPPELQGLNPKDLLQAGLETVPPITLLPQPVDSDATIPVARPQSTQTAVQVELPLPEELTKLLPGGNYHVESFLGQGGMGAVYKGMQVRLKRPVAIKIMRRDMGKDYDFEARFEREAQAMAKLNHPNIVSVIDFGEAVPDYLYIVMELIDGADLMDVIRGGQMTQEMALSLLPQVCDALQFAHDHGIVHRDIKPSNIMLTRDGRVKMCDFGLAKRYDVESSFRTQTGTGMGTPDYAAPEQFDPKANIDHRADIYALGVMIYQMITGQLPRGVWKPPSQRAEVAPQWDDIVSRAMQSDPSDRYQQASEVKTDVTSIPLAAKSGAGTPARPSSKRGEDAKTNEAHKSVRAPVQSRAPMIFGILAGAVVIALGAFFALRGGKPSGTAVASTTPSATKPTAPATASTTKAAATSIPIPAPALPESGWKPLISKTEWETDWNGGPFQSGNELVNGKRRLTKEGLLHIQNTHIYKAISSADGAIRVESVVHRLPHVINLGGRRMPQDKGRYAFGITSDSESLLLRFMTKDQPKPEVLKQCPLPTPIKVGDRLKLELRIQGTQLTGLWNGLAVLQAQDQRLTAAGEWGLDVVDATIQSVEVQPLSGGASMPPQGIAKIAAPSNPTPQWRKIEFANLAKTAVGKNRLENGLLHVTNYESWKPEAPVEIWQNGAVRTTLLWEGEANTNGTQINVRGSDRGSYFARPYNSELQVVFRMKAGQGERLLGKFPIQPPLQPNKEVSVQMAAIGSQLNVWVNDRQIGFVQDEALIEPGAAFIRANATRFKSFDVINLDGLPEDEALKILGAEVKGADLSGASATPRGAANTQAALSAAEAVGTATKDKPFTNTLGMKFVPVPIGGGPTKGHKVLFSVWHTRVQDYATYVKAQEAAGQKMDGSWKTQSKENVAVGQEPDHPVVGVSWEDAQAFCQWLTEKETAEGKLPNGLKYRMPTDEEWSWAVGLPAESGAKYRSNSVDFPWGKDFPPTIKVGNYADETFHAKFPKDFNDKGNDQPWIKDYTDGYVTTSPVGSFPANAYGLHDMGGNVWQWCEDWQDKNQKNRVLRGGSWGNEDRGSLLSSNRHLNTPATRNPTCGFRCVLSAETVPPTAAATTAATSPAYTVSSSSVKAATKAKPFINTLGMKFVPVPIGGGPTKGQQVLFSVWHTRVQDYAAYVKAQEAAGKKVNGSWRTQSKESIPLGREPDHPVVGVSWDEVQGFCRWLTEKENTEGKLPKGLRYRLPSDEEWSWAVGLRAESGATPEEKNGKNSLDFPWGNDYPPTRKIGNFADESYHERFPIKELQGGGGTDNGWLRGYDDGFATTSPAGSFTYNAYGLYDMSGNAWQWCEDWWNKDQKERVLRGASWNDNGHSRLLSSNRNHNRPELRYNSNGFRCVLSSASVTSSAAQSPSYSPSPPASKSYDKVLPGQWVKLFTKADDLPTDLRRPDSGVIWKDGWIRFDRLKGGRPRFELPAAVTGKSNYAVRLRGIGSGKPSFQTGIILRRQTSPSDRHYQFSPQSPVPLKIVRREGDAHFDLARLTKPLVQAGEEYTMEFVALGNYLIGRYNMEIITARDDRFSEGTACISGTEDIRDIEVINLDSLPEADALKILGVDEKGNDLRGKTTSASSPSSPAAAAVATQFALGEWVRPFKDITSIHETWIKAGATWVDGWITPGPGLNHSITLAAPNGRGKNWGVRACYRWQEKGGAGLLLRRGGKAADNTVSAYQLKVESSRASFSRVQGNGSKQGAQITELGIAQPMNLEARDEVVIEAFALGNMLYGRVDGQIFKVPSDGQLSSGDFEAAARLLSYRDIEFINLDGLPEAEALRLLGVDEQGKDLRGKAEAAAPPADAK